MIWYEYTKVYLVAVSMIFLLQLLMSVCLVYASENYPPDYGCQNSLSESNDVAISSATNQELGKYFADLLGCADIDTTSEQSQPRGDWLRLCSDLQVVLVSSCYALVNPNNTLTLEGERVVDCIRTSFELVGGSSFLLSTPLPLIIDTLQNLKESIGCGSAVKWGLIGNVNDLRGVINRLT